jgi:hypothetical protein
VANVRCAIRCATRRACWLRVSLFAQELGARGGVSPKKLAQRLSQLRRG